MSKEKKSKISYFQSNFTSTISVALVLLLLGIIAFLGILANTFSKELKENIGFSVVLQSETTPEQVAAMDKMWKASPYVSDVKFISKEAALQNWQAETGDLDSLQVIERQLKTITFVDEIAMHKSEVDAANRNISNVALVLFVIAVLLMLISFVLINNTVRLTVYSRRFLIHTMKLVGAKPGFIRRPFVISNMLNGLIAAFVSMLFLLGVYLFLQNIDEALVVSFSALEIVAVFAGLIVLGVLICGLAAFLAADKYIRLSYDDLFKR